MGGRRLGNGLQEARGNRTRDAPSGIPKKLKEGRKPEKRVCLNKGDAGTTIPTVPNRAPDRD